MATNKQPIKTESVLWSSANLMKGIYLTGVTCALYFGLKRDNDEIKSLLIEYRAKQTGIDNVQDVKINYLTNYLNRTAEFIKPKEVTIETVK